VAIYCNAVEVHSFVVTVTTAATPDGHLDHLRLKLPEQSHAFRTLRLR
jgi:hypothetical protein